MLGRLLGKSKKKRVSNDPLAAIEVDESIDLESGTIYIDESIDPDRVVKTTEVFEQVAADDTRTRLGGGGAKVFILDLRPFFKVLGTKKGESSALKFARFAENWLARSLGAGGIYEFIEGEIFFFRLNMPNHEAPAEAVKIINDIGSQYLRDAFKSEQMLPEVLGAVDEAEATRDGAIDLRRAAAVLGRWRAIGGKATMAAALFGGETADKAEVDTMALLVPIRAERPANQRVKRGPERRAKKAAAHAGPEKRRRRYGRRATDDPRNGASW
jgi:hypothetical protein